MVKESFKDRMFSRAITLTLILIAVTACIPLVSEIAISFSSKAASDMNAVNLWPVGFTLDSWKCMMTKGNIWSSFFISLTSTLIGTVMALTITALMAYPMSKGGFKIGKYLMLFVIFTMIFKAPTVPYFLTLKSMGLYNSYWVLIFPHILTAYNLVIMRTFFKQLPAELEEAAMIDGCGPFQMLFKIVLPASKAVMATLGLFYAVTMWNQYQHPVMFIQKLELYPLQLKIRQIIDGGGDFQAIAAVKHVNYTEATLSAAAVGFAIVPILIFYPWLQKYFAKGAMLGSVKG